MATRQRINSGHVYTMRELNHETAKVIEEINESGLPAVVTRRGRPVALIRPLANERVEAAVLDAVIESVETKSQLVGNHTLSRVMDSDEVAEAAGIEYNGNYRE